MVFRSCDLTAAARVPGGGNVPGAGHFSPRRHALGFDAVQLALVAGTNAEPAKDEEDRQQPDGDDDGEQGHAAARRGKFNRAYAP